MKAEMKEKRQRLQHTFMLLTAGASLIVVAASPLVFYAMFAGLSLALLSSLKKWSNLHQPNLPQQNFHFDLITKICIGAFTVLLGLYFSHLSILSQMILAGAATAGVSYYFVQECVLGSQKKLNNALIEAARQSDLALVEALRARGADPFATDKTGYNALHSAIRNHENAPQIINILRQAQSDPEPKLRHLLPGLDDFRGREGAQRQQYRQAWHNFIEHFKGLFGEGDGSESRNRFYQSCSEVYGLYSPIFSRTLDTLTRYLRHHMAYPKNLEAKTGGNQTALDLIAEVVKDSLQMRLVLREALTKAPEPVRDVPERPTIVDEARTLVMSTMASAVLPSAQPATGLQAPNPQQRVRSPSPTR